MSDVDQNSLLETPERLLRHECPLWIWEPDTGVFLWANSEGVKFWRESTLEALQARPVDDQHPAWITVRDELQKSVSGASVDLTLTFPPAFGGTNYTANCRRAKLHGKNAIIIEVRDNNYSQNKTHIDKVEDRGSFENGEVTSSQQDFKPPPHSKNVDPHTNQRTSNDNEKSPLIPPPTNDEALFERPAKDSLIELARLINQVRIGGDQLREGEDTVASEPPHDAKAPAGAKPKLEHTHDRPIIEEGFAHFENPSGELPSIDMTELSGMRDQAELERIFDAASGALAFTNGAQLIYANQAFASFFGYTDFRSLREDGLDWILPGQSDFFSTLLQTQNVNRRLAAEMRLRSGRRMSGVIDLTSVKVTRFGKIFLHLSLVAENTCENIGEHQASIHSTTQVEGKPQAITVDETSSTDERSSLLSISQLAAISHENQDTFECD